MAIKKPKYLSKLNNKQKRILLTAGISVFVLALGFTIAYNMDAINFNNIFGLGGKSEEIYIDTFESPTGWAPCEKIPKTATATNKNKTIRYARMKIDEYWRTADSETPASDHTTSDLPNTWTDSEDIEQEYGIIHTQNDNKWELRGDGWYYYTDPLQENDTTLSLLESVELNCKAKLVEDGTATATQTGQTGESTPTVYAGAKFHVYVTMQLSDVEWPISQHQADCDSNVLYDTIACQTNGIDSGVDFTQVATKATGNGNGVNTLAAHARDEYPVYYFRGEVDNNFVIWAGKCWRAVRTTDTGGVKLIYAGAPSDGKCLATGSDAVAFGSYWNNHNFDLSRAGYMYGNKIAYKGATSGFEHGYMSNNVSWANGIYSLDMSEGQYIEGKWSYVDDSDDIRHRAVERYHYFCADGSSSCDKVYYLYYICALDDSVCRGGQLSYAAFELTPPYWNIDELLYGNGWGGFSNNIASNAATQTANWFANNLITASERPVETSLEDAVFCNDRTFYTGTLAGKDSGFPSAAMHYIDATGKMSSEKGIAPWSYFSAYGRTMDDSSGALHPSVDCARRDDSFTKSDDVRGNAKLDYMVGQPTADEIVLAGLGESSYLYTGIDVWTMSPGHFQIGGGIAEDPFVIVWNEKLYLMDLTTARGGDYWYNGYNGFRPMVSLKEGTVYSAGDGTKNDPYIIVQPWDTQP